MADNPVQEGQVPVPAKSSGEEQDARIQSLEREVDLLKTSIKRLLIDIRERMNEMENPFTIAAMPGAKGNGTDVKSREKEADAAKNAEYEKKEADLRVREEQLKADQQKIAAPSPSPMPHYPQQLPPQYPAQVPLQYPQQFPSPYPVQTPPMHAGIDRHIIDEQLVAQFKAQATGFKGSAPAPQANPAEKSRLQKVYKLFRWTEQAVKKYGNDRLETILQSFRTMGYITKDSYDEIKEIAKLMPASLGDEHEVGPDEFVSELYTLNRIIAPDDTSLDRDMIEVMMEQRSQMMPSLMPSPVPRVEFPTVPAKEKKPARNQEFEEDWMNLPDRI
jgi:archaellum component FlaD/FlaE